MQAYLVPCWWIGWWLWRAGCISQDTYLLYIDIVKLDVLTKQLKEIVSDKDEASVKVAFDKVCA